MRRTFTAGHAPVPVARQDRFRDLPGIGHNNGPPFHGGWAHTCWRKAQAKAWKTPPIEVVRRRCKRARELGLTYREYTLEILERGRNL